MTRRARIICSVMGIGGLALVVCSGLFFAEAPALVINQLAVLDEVAFYTGIVMLCVWAILDRRAADLRLAEIRAEKQRLYQESLGAPDFSNIDASQAVLTLVWSVDLKTLSRQNVLYVARSPLTWVTIVLSGMFLPGFAVYIGWTNVPGILLIFVICTALGILARYDTILYNLRGYFPDPKAVRHIALVVDSTGMLEITGRIVKTYPWAKVRSVRETKGIVLIRFRGEGRLIPDYAFHTHDDAAAFVSTINALRTGKTAPAYDWSAYKAELPEVEGVWPPPIRS